MEKGYVQYRCEHRQAPAPTGATAEGVCLWRNRLWQAGLVGQADDGIGFGNVSVRTAHGFVITGTATGGVEVLRPEHLTEVTSWDLHGNSVACSGPVVASSEALTHGAAYDADAAIGAVVHVHHRRLWQRLLHAAPTTDMEAEAGTPAMGFAIERVIREGAVRGGGIVVMGGHPDGLLALGPTLEAAARRVLEAAAG
jgi:L-ribulose-5-phosphate 4-epimerase